jgi:probable phosphoglycerate mutase
MSRIVLVRHGETIWHAENRYAGRTDIALTPRGNSQALQLARWAAAADLSAIWCSPLSRSRLTAQPAADAAHLPLQVDARLTELDFGCGEGLTDREMRERFPEARAAFVQDPAANFLPGGENPILAAQRGAAALRDIASIVASDARVLAVAHNTLIRILLCDLLQIPISRYRTAFPTLANGTLTEICLTSGSAGLLSFNLPVSPSAFEQNIEPNE